MRAFLGGRQPILVSVHAFEDEVNAIPEMFAEALAAENIEAHHEEKDRRRGLYPTGATGDRGRYSYLG